MPSSSFSDTIVIRTTSNSTSTNGKSIGLGEREERHAYTNSGGGPTIQTQHYPTISTKPIITILMLMILFRFFLMINIL
uniref:N-acetyl-D-glucosamine kinase n=1 Tax=Rhizophora mucronata TaxID=61149 RepID=A0A2P2Q592_RHIMU